MLTGQALGAAGIPCRRRVAARPCCSISSQSPSARTRPPWLLLEGLRRGIRVLLGRERGLPQLLVVLPRGPGCLAASPLGGFGLAQLAAERLDPVGLLIRVLGGRLCLRLRRLRSLAGGRGPLPRLGRRLLGCTALLRIRRACRLGGRASPAGWVPSSGWRTESGCKISWPETAVRNGLVEPSAAPALQSRGRPALSATSGRPLYRSVWRTVAMLTTQLDSAARGVMPTLRGELAQFIPCHPLLRVLKGGAELEEGGQLVRFLASEQVDQPGTAGRSPQLADLRRERVRSPACRTSATSCCRRSTNSSGEGVELVGCSLQIHGAAPEVRPTVRVRS